MNDDKPHSITHEEVPAELWKRVATFLDPKQASNLSQTCCTIRRALALSKVALTCPIIERAQWYGHVATGDIPLYARSIPLFLASRVHTVRVKCLWKDQGWGNAKGRLYVIGSTSDRHRIAAASLLAGHIETSLRLQFIPQDGEEYTLWYKAGSGGGHSLEVSRVRLEFILLDGLDFAKTYNALAERGALKVDLDFHFQLLQKVAQALLEQIQRQETPDINMTSFLESTGIPVRKETLLALEHVTASLLELGNYTISDAMAEDRQAQIRAACFPAPPAPPQPIQPPQVVFDPLDEDSDEEMGDLLPPPPRLF